MAKNTGKKSSSKSGSAKKAVPLKEKEVPRSEVDLSDLLDYSEEPEVQEQEVDQVPESSAQHGPEPEETIQRKKRKRKESPTAKKRGKILDDLTMVSATREDVTATDDH